MAKIFRQSGVMTLQYFSYSTVEHKRTSKMIWRPHQKVFSTIILIASYTTCRITFSLVLRVTFLQINYSQKNTKMFTPQCPAIQRSLTLYNFEQDQKVQTQQKASQRLNKFYASPPENLTVKASKQFTKKTFLPEATSTLSTISC